MNSALLQATGMRKAFPGVLALNGVDFELEAGEVHSLMGENGAGKSTLIKLLTGAHTRDAGSIELEGAAIFPRSPSHAQQLGISTVYQEVNLVPNLSIAENVVLGRQPKTGGVIRWAEARRRTKAAMARLSVEVDPRQRLGAASIALQQLVAIARALDCEAKVLILDEPTSSLDRGEVERLFDVLRGLKAQGMGIVFISHFLDQVYEISDRITILRNGNKIGTFEAAGLPRLSLVAQMLGRSEQEIEQAQIASEKSKVGDVALEASGIQKRGVVGPLDISVREREVLGFAGLLGSGRTESVSLLFGALKRDRGTIKLGGKPAKVDRPAQGIRAGIGFVPEDRKVEALCQSLSVRENIVLASQVKTGWLRRISSAKQVAMADRFIKALRIATPSPNTPVGQLSGGNQQKVVLARWLASQPKVLILDEPTRGIDVGAKAEIEKLMVELCGEGLAIILVATDLEEVVRDSHRIVVMRDRKKVGELEGDAIKIERIMEMMATGA